MRATVTKLGDQGWFGRRMTQQFINDKGVVHAYPPQPSLRETSRSGFSRRNPHHSRQPPRTCR
jgi:hypothetical protein